MLVFQGKELQRFKDFLAEMNIAPLDFTAIPKPTDTTATTLQKTAWINDNKTALRRLLQLYGTEYRRHENDTYWTDKLQARIERHISNGVEAIFVDDVRFLNETKLLGEIGFTFVRIQASDETRTARGAANVGAHDSETQLDNYYHDFIVFNDGELHELYKNLDGVVTKLTTPVKR